MIEVRITRIDFIKTLPYTGKKQQYKSLRDSRNVNNSWYSIYAVGIAPSSSLLRPPCTLYCIRQLCELWRACRRTARVLRPSLSSTVAIILYEYHLSIIKHLELRYIRMN